jgi:hypothetical protein
MKKFILLPLLLSIWSTQILCAVAAVVPVQQAIMETESAVAPALTLGELVEMTPREWEAQSGEKLSFGKRLAFKIVQKKIKKQAAKGNLDLSAPAGRETLSTLSLIFSVVGLALLFVPVLGFLGLALGIAGFVLGLVSFNKEGTNIKNILGVVFGAVIILLFLVGFILLAAALVSIR